jgi:hypothetical protein
MIEGSGPEPDPDPYLLVNPDPGGPKHVDPDPDSDPQHCFTDSCLSFSCASTTQETVRQYKSTTT